MKTLIKLLLLASVFLLVIFACKKDQLEIKKTADPCDCASEVSADFDILERHSFAGGGGALTTTDNVLSWSTKEVRFRAKQNDAEYTWYIGADKEYEREVFSNFGTEWIGSTIPVTLVVKKKPNLICFPNDDGYDSITKTFKIYEMCHEPYLLEGTFRMAEKNSSDSIDIKIEFKQYAPWNDCLTADITNFDGEGSTCPGNYFRGSKSYRYFQVSGTPTGSCESIGAFKAWNHLSGICEMKYFYRIDGDPNKEVNKHIYGRKLN
ncbi:hypothetical protein ERX46_00510 [Brumimicrobium glaciale]|uniref:Lipoprotein n=1 Tax=Brumimicrobium glaciale TaxID=200475 RepID=A0A4Q4KQP2_9FLAO|nr:hypothetical protein [Brumimicrobium glaciale]RYM35503.1 hypothetical protein ERX46_00510 [Brumimicrobium glaciale]